MRYQTLEEVTTPNGVLEFGPVVARPIRTVQARQEFFLVEQLAHPIFWASRSATVPPIKKFSPATIFDAAFEGGQSVGPAFDQLRLSLLAPEKWDAPPDKNAVVRFMSLGRQLLLPRNTGPKRHASARNRLIQNVKRTRIPAAASAGSNAEFLDLMHPLCG